MQENKIKDLTTGSLRTHLRQLALPIMGTAFVQIAYSFTDMAWLGRLSSEAVAAVGAVSVFIWIANSISMLNKTGCEVTISQSIGAGKLDEARLYASHNIGMSLILGVALPLLYALFAEPLIDLYQLEPVVRAQALDYMYVCLIGFPEVFLTAALFGLYNAIGDSKTPFRVMGLGLMINMILDPLLIHGCGMGVVGAALATVLSQAVVFAVFLYQLRVKDKLFGGFPLISRMQTHYLWRILKIGVPSASLHVLFAFVSIYMGRMVSSLGAHVGVATLTTGAQLEALTWNTAFGVTTALTTIVGQNFAAGKLDRVREVYRTALGFTLTVGFLGMLFYIFAGQWLFSLIVPDPATYQEGGRYLRISGLSQMLMMIEITTEGLFYGIGRTYFPAVVSIVGNYLRIPMVLLFVSWDWGLSSAWWAISISAGLKGLAMLLAYLWWARSMKHQH